jgi:hypothetical protein
VTLWNFVVFLEKANLFTSSVYKKHNKLADKKNTKATDIPENPNKHPETCPNKTWAAKPQQNSSRTCCNQKTRKLMLSYTALTAAPKTVPQAPNTTASTSKHSRPAKH